MGTLFIIYCFVAVLGAICVALTSDDFRVTPNPETAQPVNTHRIGATMKIVLCILWPLIVVPGIIVLFYLLTRKWNEGENHKSA